MSKYVDSTMAIQNVNGNIDDIIDIGTESTSNVVVFVMSISG